MTLNRFIRKEGCVVKDNFSNERFKIEESEVVATSLGEHEPFILLFKSGDFCVATSLSIFQSRAKVKNSFRLLGSLCKVRLSKLPRKRLFVPLDFDTSKVRGTLGLLMQRESVPDSEIFAGYLFVAALLRIRFEASPENLLNLRTFADSYGYNVKYAKRSNSLRISFFRRRWTKLDYIFYPFKKDDTITDYKYTVIGKGSYSNQGFAI